MAKFIVILLIALILEAVGVVFLKEGLKQTAAREPVRRVADAVQIARHFVANRYFWLGILFEALFFIGLLTLLSQKDVSVVWPLTACGFIVTTLAAKFFLHEEVPLVRWIGVVLIMGGAALITWKEQEQTSARSSAPAPILKAR